MNVLVPKRSDVSTLDALEVANRLRPVLLRLARDLRRETHAQGITAGQVHILAEIRDRPGIGVVELAAREQVSPPSMSNHIDRLETGGMVTRLRATGETEDRRRVGLSITPEGRRALAAVRSRRTAWLAAGLRGLTPEELTSIEGALDALTRLVNEAPPAGLRTGGR